MNGVIVNNIPYSVGDKLILRKYIKITDEGVIRWAQGVNKITRITIPNGDDLKKYSSISEGDYLIQLDGMAVFTTTQISKFFIHTD